MTAAEKVRRDASLALDRARGFGWQTLANKYGITARQAQNIYRARESLPFPEADQWEEVREAIEFREAAIEDLADLASTTEREGLRRDAITAKLRAHDGLLELKRLYGLLPLDAQHFRTEADLLKISELLLAAFERHAVPDDLRKDVAEIFRRPQLPEAGWATRTPDRLESDQSLDDSSTSEEAA